ncbi:MAG: hypothetical protein L3J70_11670 [Gammaproteobacteria bacterium]|nr:hypothetical protein [Gammaproteobacteria bacterium]
MSKVDDKSAEQASGDTGYRTTWGTKLFWGVLIGLLVFFWWLLIYSHGIEVSH